MIDRRTLVIAFLCLSVAHGITMGEDLNSLRQQDSWGPFEPDAWKLVEITKQSRAKNGVMVTTSIRETLTKLHQVDDEKVSLQVSVTEKLGGRRINAPIQEVRHLYVGQFAGETKVADETLATEDVVIGRKQFRCRVRQVAFSGPRGKRTSKIYTARKVYPVRIRQETITEGTEGSDNGSKTIVELVAFEIPHQVLENVKTVSHLKTEHTHKRGTTTTLEILCPDVPGAIVAHWSVTKNSSGQVTERSMLKLLDYGSQLQATQQRESNRERQRRRSRSGR